MIDQLKWGAFLKHFDTEIVSFIFYNKVAIIFLSKKVIKLRENGLFRKKKRISAFLDKNGTFIISVLKQKMHVKFCEKLFFFDKML